MISSNYLDKRVLVTGHTGFKGSWLTVWLLKLGAKVTGVSKDVPTCPSMFEALGLEDKIDHIQADVTDLQALAAIIKDVQPQFIFHLAAQAIVSTSYENPTETFSTNVLGTMNVLDALRLDPIPCVVVMITSDKCYDNVEWLWGYKETDALGGKDIYSGSKGAAELVIKSYVSSFFSDPASPVKIAVGRAGNVIGGGDWAKDRIIVDCMRAWNEKRHVEIRSPKATRPWQHVLEPLSGYLTLGARLAAGEIKQGDAFNFGPRAEQNRTVVDLIGELAVRWGFDDVDAAYKITGNVVFYEASLLKLNCDKALALLNWEPNMAYAETIAFVGDWYKSFYQEHGDMYEITCTQIDDYENMAIERNRVWAK